LPNPVAIGPTYCDEPKPSIGRNTKGRMTSPTVKPVSLPKDLARSFIRMMSAPNATIQPTNGMMLANGSRTHHAGRPTISVQM